MGIARGLDSRVRGNDGGAQPARWMTRGPTLDTIRRSVEACYCPDMACIEAAVSVFETV